MPHPSPLLPLLPPLPALPPSLPLHLAGVRALHDLGDGGSEDESEIVRGSELHELVHEHGGQSAGPEQGGHILCYHGGHNTNIKRA